MIHAGIRNKATAESVSSRKTTPGSRQFFRETSSSVVRNSPLGWDERILSRSPHGRATLAQRSRTYAKSPLLAPSPAQGAKKPAARGRESGSTCILPPAGERRPSGDVEG